MKKNKYYQNQNAFTLVELTIVLVILALLTGGVVAGQSLLEQAKMRNFVTDVESTLVSIKAFEGKYGYLPGDIPDATSYWAATDNGNGDGFYPGSDAPTGERVYMWHHLSLARMVEHNYDRPDTVAKVIEAGRTSLDVPLGASNVGLFAEYRTPTGTNDDRYNITENYLMLAGWVDDSGQASRGGAFSPVLAENIDRKMDDGEASSGKVVGFNQSVGTGTDCATDDWRADYGGADYDLSHEEPTCRMAFYF